MSDPDITYEANEYGYSVAVNDHPAGLLFRVPGQENHWYACDGLELLIGDIPFETLESARAAILEATRELEA